MRGLRHAREDRQHGKGAAHEGGGEQGAPPFSSAVLAPGADGLVAGVGAAGL